MLLKGDWVFKYSLAVAVGALKATPRQTFDFYPCKTTKKFAMHNGLVAFPFVELEPLFCVKGLCTSVARERHVPTKHAQIVCANISEHPAQGS